MKMTLLQMTQSILSAMDSDEINSISDTTESLQVVSVIRSCYNDIAATTDMINQYSLFQLDPSLDVSMPTVMYQPEDVVNIQWVKYDWQTVANPYIQMTDLVYIPSNEFLRRMYYLTPTDTFVGSFILPLGTASIPMFYTNNIAPTYWTSFDNHTLLFDSFDNTVDNTLQKSKTTCYGLMTTVFTESDSFVPPLDDQQFSILYNSSKALAFAELKQATHGIAERKERRALMRLQNNKRTTGDIRFVDTLPNYGRRKARNSNSVNFGKGT